MQSIAALALLITLVTSMNCILNSITSQASMLGQLPHIGNRYLILSKNCSSLSNSCVNLEVQELLNFSGVESCFAQKIFFADINSSVGSYKVSVRAVDNPTKYLSDHSASINGSAARVGSDVDIGLLLANSLSIAKGDSIQLGTDAGSFQLTVVGVINSGSPLDAELIVPLETTRQLTPNYSFSTIEFTLNHQENIDSLVYISNRLPSNLEIVKVQQTDLFIQQSTEQIVNFLTAWYMVVYVLVFLACFVVCSRVVIESKNELAVLKAIGGSQRRIFSLIFFFSLLIALFGCILGVSLGVAGTQVVSTIIQWFSPSVVATPFLEIRQFMQILMASLLFCAIGCFYPSFRYARRKTEKEIY